MGEVVKDGLLGCLCETVNTFVLAHSDSCWHAEVQMFCGSWCVVLCGHWGGIISIAYKNLFLRPKCDKQL